MIITNKKTDKDFSGNPCLLLREITEEYNSLGIKTYCILTKRVNYVEKQEYVYPEPIEQEDGTFIQPNPTLQTVTRLETIDFKDSKRYKKLSKEEYNFLYSLVKDKVVLENNDLWKFEEDLKLEALLLLTKQDEPYDTVADDWIKLEQ